MRRQKSCPSTTSANACWLLGPRGQAQRRANRRRVVGAAAKGSLHIPSWWGPDEGCRYCLPARLRCSCRGSISSAVVADCYGPYLGRQLCPLATTATTYNYCTSHI